LTPYITDLPYSGATQALLYIKVVVEEVWGPEILVNRKDIEDLGRAEAARVAGEVS
jgi:hypothetical protein